MKKIILIAVITIESINIQSQNSFGVTTYPRPDAVLTSGRTVNNSNGGFLMSGVRPIAASSTANFYIDRLSLGGLPGLTPGFFQTDYMIFNSGPLCPVSAPQTINTYGSNVTEVQGTVADDYFFVVTTDAGVIHGNVSNTGAINSKDDYTFPSGATIPSARPVVTEYANSTGYYAISANGIIYLQEVDMFTSLVGLQQGFQKLGSNLVATGILIEPYTGSNLITIVGYVSGGTTGQDGFFMQVNRTTFAITNYIEFDQGSINNNNNTFQCIVLDNSPALGGPGFLIGGNSESIVGNPGKAWMLKLNASGAVAWSSVIDGSTNPSSGKIHAIFQRFSGTYGRWENYGACSANAGITIYRLDELGLPLSLTPGTNDEFVYNIGTSSTTWPVDISYNNTGAISDEGMQIYGNMNLVGADPYFVEAYFTGESGCQIITNINQVDQSAVTANNITIGTTAALSYCGNATVIPSANNIYRPVCGPFTTVPPGSNLKQINGVNNFQKNEATINIQPIPASEAITISTKTTPIESIKIINVVGQVVYEKSLTAGVMQFTIDITTLGIEPGSYFVYTGSEQGTAINKIIITK